MPGAPFAALGPQTQPRMTAHDTLVVHTMAGSFAGTRAMFMANGYGGTESTFGLRADGYLEQWQDGAYSADANYLGSGTVWSLETEDYGGVFGKWDLNNGALVPAWTPHQCEAIARWLAWGSSPATHAGCPVGWRCRTEGIPLALIPDTKPGRRGVGYHAQGVPGNGLVPGGVAWSKATGKVCPGARRIAQVPGVIARAQQLAGAAGAIITTEQEDDDVSEHSRSIKSPYPEDGGKLVTLAELAQRNGTENVALAGKLDRVIAELAEAKGGRLGFDLRGHLATPDKQPLAAWLRGVLGK